MFMFQKLIKFHANSCISNGLSKEKISSVAGFERPFIEYTNAKINLKFDGSNLRQKLLTSIGSIANYYIVYRLSPRTNSSSTVLEKCLFGKIKVLTLTKLSEKLSLRNISTDFNQAGRK